MISSHTAGVIESRFWERMPTGRVRCTLCPCHCKLREGQRGACFVRACKDGKVVLTTYGKSSGFCVDPIEKKPLNHFLPGTPTLSFGTAGCNLGCAFCQNWQVSTSREWDTLADSASPEDIAAAALYLASPAAARVTGKVMEVDGGTEASNWPLKIPAF